MTGRTTSHRAAKPRLLDLFCGAGGAAMGYSRAGFDVFGVDINPQPNYPFRFWQGDALDTDNWPDFPIDAIHASPPCQFITSMSNRWRGQGGRADSHTNLIPPTRAAIQATGLPYIIENVPAARSHLDSPIVLNGGMFGLGVDRPRLFELNWPILVPTKQRVTDAVGVYGKAADGRLLWKRADGTEQRAASSVEEGGEAMGIDWMAWRELAEAIPPAYTEFIGLALLEQIEVAA